MREKTVKYLQVLKKGTVQTHLDKKKECFPTILKPKKKKNNKHIIMIFNQVQYIFMKKTLSKGGTQHHT